MSHHFSFFNPLHMQSMFLTIPVLVVQFSECIQRTPVYSCKVKIALLNLCSVVMYSKHYVRVLYAFNEHSTEWSISSQ